MQVRVLRSAVVRPAYSFSLNQVIIRQTARLAAILLLLVAIAAPALAGDRRAPRTSGQVYAWGNNIAGQLGDGTFTDHLTPVPETDPNLYPGTVAIAEGLAHSLILKADGTGWAFGDNASGELGNNTTVSGATPVQVVGSGGTGFLSGIVAVSAGTGFSVALKSDGTVWAWGANSAGQLGDGTDIQRNAPIQVPGPP